MSQKRSRPAAPSTTLRISISRKAHFLSLSRSSLCFVSIFALSASSPKSPGFALPYHTCLLFGFLQPPLSAVSLQCIFKRANQATAWRRSPVPLFQSRGLNFSTPCFSAVEKGTKAKPANLHLRKVPSQIHIVHSYSGCIHYRVPNPLLFLLLSSSPPPLHLHFDISIKHPTMAPISISKSMSLSQTCTSVLASLFLFLSLSAAQSSTATTTSSASTTTASIYPGTSNWAYLGCYNETTLLNTTNGNRALNGGITEANDQMTVPLCLAYCLTNSFAFAGLEYTRECYCAQYISALSTKISDSVCNLPCKGNSSELCGGSLALSVYQTKSSTKGAGVKIAKEAPVGSVLALITAMVFLLCLA